MKNNKLRKILLGCAVALIITVNINLITAKATEPPTIVQTVQDLTVLTPNTTEPPTVIAPVI